MRYVPILEKDEKPDDEWLKKAQELTKTLESEPDAERRKRLIEDNKAHWGRLKEWLLKLSAGKCWYSEAKDCVQYWEVEHFRPKNAAKDEDGKEIHEGYWWLAFDWHNYRIAGQVINRKKGAYFPLRDGSFVAVLISPANPAKMSHRVFSIQSMRTIAGLCFLKRPGRLFQNQVPMRGSVIVWKYRVNGITSITTYLCTLEKHFGKHVGHPLTSTSIL